MLLKIQYLVLHNICHIVNTCLFSEKFYCFLLIESQNKADKEKAAFKVLLLIEKGTNRLIERYYFTFSVFRDQYCNGPQTVNGTPGRFYTKSKCPVSQGIQLFHLAGEWKVSMH